MGIYDREYYRREGPGFLDSLTRTGQVCKWLLAINVAAFVLQLLTRDFDVRQAEELSGPFTNFFILDVGQVLHGQVWRLLTYAFLHDTNALTHIFFNMLFLWWFGSEIETIYGSREFLSFYLLSALLGGIAFLLFPEGIRLMAPGRHLCLGASGAVTAVMVVYACHFPTRVIYLFFLIPVPIWLLVVFEVCQDLFHFLGGGGTTTAVSVHLAGAGFGFLYYKMHWRVSNLWTWLLERKWQRPRPRLRVFRDEEGVASTPVSVAAPPPAGGEVDEQLEAKLDAVLEKVARSGQGSLTESERAILFRASEIYKRRRS